MSALQNNSFMKLGLFYACKMIIWYIKLLTLYEIYNRLNFSLICCCFSTKYCGHKTKQNALRDESICMHMHKAPQMNACISHTHTLTQSHTHACTNAHTHSHTQTEFVLNFCVSLENCLHLKLCDGIRFVPRQHSIGTGDCNSRLMSVLYINSWKLKYMYIYIYIYIYIPNHINKYI